jgi:hypothetical protein
MNKKILFLLGGLAALSIALTGCGNSETKETTQTNQPTQQQSNSVSESKQESATPVQSSNVETITPAGGLGDTYQVFEAKYGANAGDKEMARFAGDYIQPMFVNDKAWNVLVQFESTDKPRRVLEDTQAAIKQVIPNDSKQVKKWTVDNTKEIIMYNSPTLAKLFDKKWFGEEKPGTFIVILHRDEQGYFSFTAALGNNP